MAPEISLIIPTYNVEKYISQALQSVKDQTLNPAKYEVIIFDDGSTDNTNYVIQSCINSIKNMGHYRRIENKGAAITRNEAIDQAQGRLISLLDADDLLEPNALESTLNFMNTNPQVRYSYSKHTKVDAKENVIRKVHGIPYDSEKILHFNFVGPIKTFDRELHEEIGGYDPSTKVEDYEHILKVSVRVGDNQIAQNPEFLYRYIIHGTNKALTGNQTIENSAINSKELFNATKNKDKQLDICKSIKAALAYNGIKAKAFWSHFTKKTYNYYDWEIENG